MFDLDKAVAYLQTDTGPMTAAKLAFILTGQRPSDAVGQQLFADQRPDGGFQPFWAEDYSSLDATCYRLAQAEGLGILFTDKRFSQGQRFLLARQQPSGRFQEEERVAEAAPPWVKPGEPAPGLYLTANAAFWLAQSPNLRRAAASSAAFLQRHLQPETGQLPSFLNAYWLAAGLWWLLGQRDTAVLLLTHLQTKIEAMDAANLVWLLNTMRLAGVPPVQPPIPAAVDRLQTLQAEDGRFPSSEGQDAQVTLEALRALHHYT